MFTNGLVGVDGRDGGRDAVALASALCSGLTLVHAHTADRHPWPGSAGARADARREEAQRVLEAARLEGRVQAQLLTVADRSPARALQRAAQAYEADLIVVGSAHHGALGRIALGDVGRIVLHGAPCPVAVAPKGFRDGPPRTVAVGFEGSAESWAALEVAARLAAHERCALTVYVVWESPLVPVTGMPGAPGAAAEAEPDRRRWAQELLAETLADLPGSTNGHVLHGRPRDELERIADRHDLLVIGSRGWGAARRVALDSTSDRVIHRAPCPVIVVPCPGDAGGRNRPTAATVSVG